LGKKPEPAKDELTSSPQRRRKRKASRRNAAQLADLCEHAVHDRDWDGLRALFHPNARIQLVITKNVAVSTDQAIETLQREVTESEFERWPSPAEALDDPGAALVTGSVRFRSDSGTWSHESRAWVYVAKDDLIYRWTYAQNSEAAKRAYAESGPGLGIPD
jgi:hypothetical protein